MSPSSLTQVAETAQRQAADPTTSAWVAANAGTGKTKVLTDRVLNLLLSGTAPERILCLTFTKAAAAEMANRLSRRLADWAVADDPSLAKALDSLRGQPPQDSDLQTARRLFARLLDVPGGMEIQTIHAFCTALLKRFPLEAKVPPHFETLEEQDAADLLFSARESVLAEAAYRPSSPVAQALALITHRVHETRFPDLLAAIISQRGKFQRLLAPGKAAVSARLRSKLGLDADESPASVLAAACAEGAFDRAALRGAMEVLAQGKSTDQDAAGKLSCWLAATVEDRVAGFDAYKLTFFTKDGEPRSTSRFPTKDIKERYPEVVEALAAETERLIRVEARRRSATIAEATDALLTLTEAILLAYEQAKARLGVMDFDDLILAARALLSVRADAAWVLYKLDGGIDHVLIDEAQDTNLDQWAVAEGLVAEFFSGDTARSGVRRTLFVVGDRKQSIYSFQGANPDAFEDKRASYRTQAQAAEHSWKDVTLDVSFRSTEAVLSLVDKVFEPETVRNGVESPGVALRHLAFRAGHGGAVELWPVMQAAQSATPEQWKPPVERIRQETAQSALARLLARRIRAMIGTERLESRDRPIRAGDILVLVRRRGGFVEDLVRALKTLAVPVAGVDRMVLTEQMAVMDLLALGKALLLPDDDLTLACVLKGPLVGLSEEQLFEVAHNRRRGFSLWRALRDQAAAEGPFRDAYSLLRTLMDRADFLPPHELFAHVLGPLGGRKKLLARLGPDAADPLDEFMALALAYDRAHPPSLQAFLQWGERAAQDIKRDLDEGTNAVRVMTVHGSKGLQAPVVILPDTIERPNKPPLLLWDEGEEPLCLWVPRAKDRAPFADTLIERAQLAQDREYRRLLYVALTRAEDRLIICGWRGVKEPPENGWYKLIEQAMVERGREVEDPFLVADGTLPSSMVWRLTSEQQPGLQHRERRLDDVTLQTLPLPDWTQEAPAREPSPPRPLAPSRAELPDPPVRSPLGESRDRDRRRFQRGLLIHRLLQSLPDLPRERREAAGRAFLARPVWGLSEAEQKIFLREALEVVETPAFADLFAPGSLAEVPVSGVIVGPEGKPHVVSGQVDRLVVRDTEVLIVDFKTNRPPPHHVEDVPAAYLFQMGAYRAVLESAMAGKAVRCLLVWTDGPFLMELPPEAMSLALRAKPDRPKV